MPAARCSECAASLEGKPKGTKTCGTAKCRSARQRRIKRERKANGQNARLPEGLAEVSEVVTKGTKDAAHEVLKDELRPIVREMLTEDVLRSVQTLVGLTPAAIEKLTQHLESDDDTISQRAYTLLLKYTMGNPSVAPPPTTPAQGGVTVVLGVPRPGDATPSEVAVAEELRACGDCGVEKPESDFVGDAPRCLACAESLRGMLKERFGDDYSG